MFTLNRYSMLFTINQAGMAQIRDFLDYHGKPELFPHAFYRWAEEEASRAFIAAEDAVIELGRQYSNDGQTHLLTLEPSWFDDGN